MTNQPPPPPGPRRLRPRLPAVLREEPQYRLLFAGQVLSVLGDRITRVVLPFAVLAVGRRRAATSRWSSAAQFLPFLVLALLGGRVRRPLRPPADPDQLGRRAVRRPAHRRRAAGHRAAPRSGTSPSAPRSTAPPTRSSPRRSPACCPQTVAPVNLQPANALRGLTLLDRLDRRPGARRSARRVRGGPGGALLFDAATFAVSHRVPRSRCGRGGRRRRCTTRTRRRRRRTARRARERLVARCAAATGCWRSSAAWRRTTSIVLPAIFVLGPVLAADELGRRGVVGDRSPPASASGCVRRRPAAAALAAALRAAGRRADADRRVLPGGVHRQRAAASGRSPVSRSLAGVCVDRHLHAVGDVAAGAHPGRARCRGSPATTT